MRRRRGASWPARSRDRSARVGVIGLGYVGLPMTLTMAEKGYSVLGFDIDPGKIEALNKGRNYIQHLDGSRAHRGDRLRQVPRDGRLPAAEGADVLLICVPTPLTPQREPEMSFVVETARADPRVAAARAAGHPGVHDVSGDDRTSSCGHPRGERD